METPVSAGRFISDLSPVDVVSHPLVNCSQEAFDFCRFAFRNKFDVAAGEVTHIPSHGIVISQVLRRVAEAHSLNATLILYALADTHFPIRPGFTARGNILPCPA
jgi:hypothetical protein